VTTTPTAATHLTTVITRWPDLVDALTTRQNPGWPPAMGITKVLDREDQAERAAQERLERREYGDRLVTLGASPAPIDINIVDVMQTVEADLVYLADVIAAEVQRAPISRAPAHWLLCDQLRRNKLAREDRDDPRRWRYPGYRDAPTAATWLRDRLAGAPGPFLPLGSIRADRITTVAAQAAEHIERALALARRSDRLDRPCPHCRGVLVVEGGDGQPPAVRCENCGWKRTAKDTAAA
jgi:hypothetical protein